MAGEEWDQLLNKFRREGSIASYVELRRRYPDQEITVSRFGSIEALQTLQARLNRAGIPPTSVEGSLDGAAEDVEELSLLLLEKIIERENLLKDGKTAVQRNNPDLSNAFLRYLTLIMLEAIQRERVPLPRSLFILIREQLGGPNPALHKTHQAKNKRQYAISMAAERQESGKQPTINWLARTLDEEPSTISRWFPHGSLSREVEAFREVEALRKTNGLDASALRRTQLNVPPLEHREQSVEGGGVSRRTRRNAK